MLPLPPALHQELILAVEKVRRRPSNFRNRRTACAERISGYCRRSRSTISSPVMFSGISDGMQSVMYAISTETFSN